MSELTAFNAYCRANGINANGQLATEDLAPAFSAGYKARQDALRQRVAELEKDCDEYHQVAMNHIHANEKLTAERDELLKAMALAMPVMDAHAGPTRLADFHAAIASVKEKTKCC